MPSKSIHVAAKGKISFFFLWLSSTPLYIHTIYKKEADTDIENKLVLTSVGVGAEGGVGNRGMGEWEVQTIGCKIGYKDVLYNTGNRASIL